MMKKILSILLFFTFYFSLSTFAQTVKVQAPSHVACGENFRLSYTVNTQDVEDFRCGNVPSGLEVIAGPYTSRSSSFQMVNGHTSSSSSITFTYTLYAEKNGTYNIPGARAVIGGHTVTSSGVKIVVSGSAPTNQQTAPRMHQDATTDEGVHNAGSRISGNDLFIKVSANKTHVHEQEPILLTYKVYTTVDLTQLAGKMPDLTGFHSQEIQLPQQKTFHVENVNGKNYRCVTWSQYVMYPQMTGKLEIPSIVFKGIVVQQNKNVDPFEAFFNGGSAYTEVKRDVTAPGMTIQVDPLPSRPANFSGGVGTFSINATVDKNEVKAGDPVNVHVVVSGIGNLKLIKLPALNLPKDFDKYDPKTTDKTNLTQNGVEGSMVYDYLVVPRNQGKYTIPAIEFVYYDTSTNSYKTAKTAPIELNVLKGDGKSHVSDYAAEDNDIHNLKTGSTTLSKVDEHLFGSVAYILWVIIPIIIFAVIVFIFRKRAIDNANVVMMRGKKANKVATKRLRTAAKLMHDGKQNEFYDEVLRALWGYVGDKMNIPVTDLSRDNISEKLTERSVDSEIINSFIEAIDECEYARYAPGDPKGKMDVVYEKAEKAITDIDEMLNKNKKSKTPVASVLLMLMMFAVLPASAQENVVGDSVANKASEPAVTKDQADTEYSKGNYQEAIKDYNALLKEGVSADVYYNLGNAYYRSGDVTKAVIAYERAYKLSPGDKDIRFNLQFVRNKTIDKITPQPEIFFVTWYHSLVNFTSSNTWAVTSIVFLLIALLCLLAYLFAPTMWMVKSGFYGGLVCFILFIATAFLSWQQKQEAQNHDTAIITAPIVDVVKTPAAKSTKEVELHEGTRITIIDRSMKGWLNVKLADGREGWIHPEQVEEI